MSENGTGGLWAVGSYYPQNDFSQLQTLVLEAPSATQGAVYGNIGYGNTTVLWIGPVTGSTTTDSFGNYAAAGLPAGSYTFVATGDGCDPQQAVVQVYAGEFVLQDFDLCDDPPTPVPTRTASPTPGAGTPTATPTMMASATASPTLTPTAEPPTSTPTPAPGEPTLTPTTVPPTSTPTPAPGEPTSTPTTEPPTLTPTAEPPTSTATATATASPIPSDVIVELVPEILTATQYEGVGSEHVVVLTNMQGTPLVWSSYEGGESCTDPQELPWLHVEPDAGTAMPDDPIELMVYLDTDGMAAGSYSAYLCVLDSTGLIQTMPLRMTVMADGMDGRFFLPVLTR